jgi:hypothetical protein
VQFHLNRFGALPEKLVEFYASGQFRLPLLLIVIVGSEPVLFSQAWSWRWGICTSGTLSIGVTHLSRFRFLPALAHSQACVPAAISNPRT